MTILFASRALRLGKEPNFSPITDPFVGDQDKLRLLLEEMGRYTSSY